MQYIRVYVIGGMVVNPQSGPFLERFLEGWGWSAGEKNLNVLLLRRGDQEWNYVHKVTGFVYFVQSIDHEEELLTRVRDHEVKCAPQLGVREGRQAATVRVELLPAIGKEVLYNV